ncbi:MAG: GNAT family N-acetyltransferase, partial [Dehalococcoidia bacterium]|nr:GNAT family N-acetyltransferase [Dehalococcoidia bacterium]
GWTIGPPQMVRRSYEALGSTEVMLSYEDERSTLYGLLRLSLAWRNGGEAGVKPDAATVRELHVFGPEVSLGERDNSAAQHRGLGAALLGEAERICSDEYGAGELRVLSGVGVRQYYRNLGYRLEEPYMVKRLSAPDR